MLAEIIKQLQPLMPTLQVALVGMLLVLITGKFLRTVVISVVAWFVKRSKNKIDDQLLQVAEEDLNVKPINLDGDNK